MKVKKICVIAQAYPTETDPIFMFLDNVVQKFADSDIECIVITPISWIEKKHKGKTRTYITKGGHTIKIICPRFMIYPSSNIGNFQTVKLSIDSFCRSAYRAFKKYVKSCDIIYSHFINMAGIAASYISRRKNIPCVTASGESDLQKGLNVYHLYQREIYNINGFITVSTQLKNDLISLGIVKKDVKIKVLPNAVDLSLFQRTSQQESRAQIGIPQDIFVIVFVGHFIERKGIQKVIDAINRCENVYGIFIGDNELPSKCDQALIVKKIPHEKLPLYMNAGDVFVLPTLNEGCCNAIIEAQACGLPIISSDRDFNQDILDPNSALLIDPLSEDDLVSTITLIQKDKVLKESLVNASLERAKRHDINVRVAHIIDFMKEIIDGDVVV